MVPTREAIQLIEKDPAANAVLHITCQAAPFLTQPPHTHTLPAETACQGVVVLLNGTCY
jgi:hypothetical protein